MSPRFVVALLVGPLLASCSPRDDDYLLLRADTAAGSGGPKSPVTLRFARADDGEALQVRRLLADGFGAEMLRTHAMARRFAERTRSADHGGDAVCVAVGGRPLHDDGHRVFEAGWFKQLIPSSTPVIWVSDADPMSELVAGLGRDIVDRIAPAPSAGDVVADPLRAGYVSFLRVVAAEWRPDGRYDDRAGLRREAIFARVRANTARESDRADELVRDPTVVATVLYRLAGSEAGRRMAPDAIYRPFLDAAPPKGVPPALLLGAFRNFQAKLLSAWAGAARAGRPPLNLVDLVEAYVDAYPAERAEVTRIFLVTTHGATALTAPIPRLDGEEVFSTQLAALTADVLFGRRGLRDGLLRARP